MLKLFTPYLSPSGVSKLLVSLGHTGRRRLVLDHTLNTQTLTKTDEERKVLSKCMILCLATFIAILGCMQPVGHGLDTPDCKASACFCQIYSHALLLIKRFSAIFAGRKKLISPLSCFHQTQQSLLWWLSRLLMGTLCVVK